MPETEKIITMPLGKYAGLPLNELESTYIVFSLDNTNMEEDLRKALLKELYNRYFA